MRGNAHVRFGGAGRGNGRGESDAPRPGPTPTSSASIGRSSAAPTWWASSPNDAAIDRLVTAVIVEQHDEWAVAERRYLSETSMARLRQSEAPALPTTATGPKQLAG